MVSTISYENLTELGYIKLVIMLYYVPAAGTIFEKLVAADVHTLNHIILYIEPCCNIRIILN